MGTTHKRLSYFVKWIATESKKEDDIRSQSQNIRDKISKKAKEDGITVKSTPNAGSFAKRTGLRRHVRGYSVVEGQDVDLPFVISRPNNDTSLEDLLNRFHGYAKESYPNNTQDEPTKSSVKLIFSNTKLSYDLVPMIATDDTQRQIIMRLSGEEFETSVQGHIAFTKSRTRDSKAIAGRVEFNQCVRLFKWWKEFRCDESSILNEVPSIIIELICGKLYDQIGVEKSYTDTLAKWFNLAAHLVRNRESIYFCDSISTDDEKWAVIDSQNSTNNIVSKWSGLEIDEFSEWFEEGRDLSNKLIRQDMFDDDSASLSTLIQLFGNPIKYHCSEE